MSHTHKNDSQIFNHRTSPCGKCSTGSSSNRDGPLADVKIELNSKRTWYGGFALNGGAGSTDYVSGTTLKTIEGGRCDNTQYSSADVFFVQRGIVRLQKKRYLQREMEENLLLWETTCRPCTQIQRRGS